MEGGTKTHHRVGAIGRGRGLLREAEGRTAEVTGEHAGGPVGGDQGRGEKHHKECLGEHCDGDAGDVRIEMYESIV